MANFTPPTITATMRRSILIALTASLIASCGQSAEDRQREQAQQEVDDAMRAVEDTAAAVSAPMEYPASKPAVPPADSAYVKASARLLCGARYPDNFALQGGCKRNIEHGAASIAEIRGRYRDVPEMQAALDRCVANYTENGATDFAIAGGCARNNESGMREMAE